MSARRILAIALAATGVLAACGADESGSPTTEPDGPSGPTVVSTTPDHGTDGTDGPDGSTDPTPADGGWLGGEPEWGSLGDADGGGERAGYDVAMAEAPSSGAADDVIGEPPVEPSAEQPALRAGSVDDNADFAGFLDYLARIDSLGIPLRSVDPSGRIVVSVAGTMETFIKQRPLPVAGGTHYARGAVGDPTGAVTNEDYAGALVVFENGARGTFEASRSVVGPESQMAFDVYGTRGALRWNLETMNEIEVFLVDADDQAPRGYTKVYAGDRYPYHGHFVPGDANAIGYEDLKVIENFEFLSAVAAGEQHQPGFAEAIDYVSFQAAWLRSCESRRWEEVVALGAH